MIQVSTFASIRELLCHPIDRRVVLDSCNHLLAADGVGFIIVDSQPFLDDNGNPIILDEEKPKDDKVEPSVKSEENAVESNNTPTSESTEQTVSTT